MEHDGRSKHPPAYSDSDSVPLLGLKSDHQLDELPAAATTSATWHLARQHHAEYFLHHDHNDIISHDPVINQSPAELARFLKEAGSLMPDIRVHVRGQSSVPNGNGSSRVKEDFSFYVPIRQELLDGLGSGCGPVFHVSRRNYFSHRQPSATSYSRPPRLPADPERAIALPADLPDESSSLSAEALPSFRHQSKPQTLQGHFLDIDDVHCIDKSRERSSAAQSYESEFRKAVEAYCTDDAFFKELVLTKDNYGYSWDAIVQAVLSVVKSTTYTGVVTVTIREESTQVIVRPDRVLSKAFSIRTAAKVFLSLTLLYPLLCLVEMLFGQRHHSLRATFPLTRWRPLPSPESSSGRASVEDAKAAASRLASREPKIAIVPISSSGHRHSLQCSASKPDAETSTMFLVGTQEGEWLKTWERAIVDAVRTQRSGGYILTEADRTTNANEGAREALRGYREQD